MADLKTQFKNMNTQLVAISNNKYNGRIERFRRYTDEEVRKIIESGTTIARRTLSHHYFTTNSIYRRILIYYATLLKAQGLLIPHETNKTTYTAVLDWVEDVNVKKLYHEIALKIMKSGSYYGIVKADRKTFSIIELEPYYCRSYYKDLAGHDLIEFNVNYFNTIDDPVMKERALEAFPEVISKYYYDFQNPKNTEIQYPWILIPPQISFSIILNDGNPPFVGIISAILDYQTATKGELTEQAEKIKKIIVQKFPHLNDGTLVFEPEEALEAHKGAVKIFKDDDSVSVLTTYADVEAVISKTSDTTISGVSSSTKDSIYTSTGVSSQIFSGQGVSAISASNKNDLGFVMQIAEIFESLFSNVINITFAQIGKKEFKYKILPITAFNEKEYLDQSYKIAASGYSYLIPAIAAGISQRDLIDLKGLENSILNLQDVLIPLANAYTTTQGNGSSTSGETAGRPTLSDEDKAETTIAQEESQTNTGNN